MSEQNKTRVMTGQDNRLVDDVCGYCKNSDNLSIEQENQQEMFDLHQVRQMPIDGMPVHVQETIEEYASALVAPRDFVAGAVLTTVATAVGKNFTLVHGSYINHPNFWLVLVAASGFNKSAPIKYILSPLMDIDMANYELYKEQLAQRAEGDPTPQWNQIIISDATPEARNQVLGRNPVRTLLLRDELRGMIDDIGRYGKSGEQSQMLSIWSNESFTVNRKSDEPMYIHDPYLNILGGIQPDILQSTFGNKLFMGNGWNHRFLFSYPELDQVKKNKPREIDPYVLADWHGWIKHLVETYSAHYFEARLSAAATEIYERFCDRIIDEINSTADDYRRSMVSKFRIHILRLAATIHVMKGGAEVSGETMEYAECLCNYFMECSSLVYYHLVKQPNQSIGKEELLRQLFMEYEVKSQSALADALNISQQQISKALKKAK